MERGIIQTYYFVCGSLNRTKGLHWPYVLMWKCLVFVFVKFSFKFSEKRFFFQPQSFASKILLVCLKYFFFASVSLSLISLFFWFALCLNLYFELQFKMFSFFVPCCQKIQFGFLLSEQLSKCVFFSFRVVCVCVWSFEEISTVVWVWVSCVLGESGVSRFCFKSVCLFKEEIWSEEIVLKLRFFLCNVFECVWVWVCVIFLVFWQMLSIWNMVIINTVCSGVSVIMCCILAVQNDANHYQRVNGNLTSFCF